MAHDHAQTLKRMEEDLKLAGCSPRTVDSYLGVASRFLRFVDKPTRRLGRDDVRRYFVSLTERQQAPSSINQAHFGVRFLIKEVLKKAWRQPLRLHKRPERMPIVLSRAEVGTLLAATESLRYRTIWMALYASGQRGNPPLGDQPPRPAAHRLATAKWGHKRRGPEALGDRGHRRPARHRLRPARRRGYTPPS